jgi:hypothetical protein
MFDICKDMEYYALSKFTTTTSCSGGPAVHCSPPNPLRVRASQRVQGISVPKSRCAHLFMTGRGREINLWAMNNRLR